ncbi:acetate--CoA ligase family protein [Myxococcota bacterium]|nr:acetate--CoA ligase family protein [Myxococcota bacterium]
MGFQESFIEAMDRAAAEGRDTLLEPELYALIREGGVETPVFFTVRGPDEALPGTLPGDRAVVKVVSPRITHKTEMGGVKVTANRPEAIREAVREVLANVRERGGEELLASVREVLVSEFVPGSAVLGGQVFVGMRHTPDFGPVLAVGFGGLDAEELAAAFGPGEGTLLGSPLLTPVADWMGRLEGSYLGRRLAGWSREATRTASPEAMARVLEFFERLAREVSMAPGGRWTVADFEVNPFFGLGDRLVAVDAFCRFRPRDPEGRPCDVAGIRTLLRPRTAAIYGVSAKDVNPGRIILRNLIREGFPREDIRVIRGDVEEVDGVACCPSLTALPWKADLVVVAVSAGQVPGILEEAIATGKAAGMVLIPGGMGETEEGQEADQAARRALGEARESGRPAPVLVGPNCLGLRSRPGRYDTLFIPETKLPLPEEGGRRNVALICQSGAFLITRINDLPFLDPRYAISTGNQMDLSLTDFVEAVLEEPEVEVLGLYIEGFQPGDGLRLARCIRRARQLGKDVLAYKGGRTAEGRTATSSHTASISGDYAACAAILRDAGAYVAESFEEFNLVLSMMGGMRDTEVRGMRLGCLSNAGFETVGMADALLQKPRFRLGQWSEEGRKRVQGILERHRLTGLVNLRNPLDITPMAGDQAYADCLEALLQDDGMDAVVVGVIPLTPAMKTLPPGVDPRDRDRVDAPGALPDLFPPLVRRHRKPVLVTVDAGPLYDPLVHALRARDLVVGRSVDSAMRCFQRYLAWRLAPVPPAGA